MNISDRLSEGLSDRHTQAISAVSIAASSIGAKAFVVGGAVRDVLLCKEIKDIDMAVECRPQKLLSSLNMKSAQVISTSRFETVKIEVFGQVIDLAMTRSEVYPKPGVLPEVQLSTIEKDLSRRDFTINALGVHVDATRWGDLIDHHGGLQDLCHRKVRVLHNQSFVDDPTRIFRAARYATRLSFEMELTTKEALFRDLDGIGKLSGTRILNELNLTFEETNSVEVLKNLDEWGVFKAIHPQLDIPLEALNTIKNSSPEGVSSYEVGLLALLYCSSDVIRDEISKRLKFSSSLHSKVYDLGRIRQLVPSMKNSDIYEKLKGLSLESLHVARSISSPTNLELPAQIDLYLSDLVKVSISVTGDDLLEIGIPEGPLIGSTLCSIHKELLDGQIETRQEQVELAKKIFSGS